MVTKNLMASSFMYYMIGLIIVLTGFHVLLDLTGSLYDDVVIYMWRCSDTQISDV